MNIKWTSTTIGDFCPFIYGKGLPADKRKPGDIPVVSSAGITGTHDEFLVNKKGIVIGRKGTVGSLTYCDGPFWAIDTAFYIADEPKKRDLRYTYYLLKTLRLDSMNSDSAVPGLNRENAHSIEIKVPSLEIQNKIASYLSALDDKIAVNLRINTTLNEIVHAFFQSWFIDFDPVRAKLDGVNPYGLDDKTALLFSESFQTTSVGHIPKNWTLGKVSDVTTINRDTINPGNFPLEEFDHYSLPSFDNQRTPKRELGSEIMSNKFVISPNSVLLSKLNPHIPRTWLPEFSPYRRSICSTEFIVAIAKPKYSREYLYSLFTSSSFESLYGTLVTGTTGSHQRVSPDSFLEIKIVIPPVQLIEEFTKKIKPIFDCINCNISESQTLSSLRDTLLPKVLSGELSVENL